MKSKHRIPLFLSLGVLVSLCILLANPLPCEASSRTPIKSPAHIVRQFQNVTIREGDITVGGNYTFLIENCQFNLTGKLIIRDSAEVIIRNALFVSNWNISEEVEKLGGVDPWRTRHVIVENQAKLTVLNSDLNLSTSYPLHDPWYWVYHSFILYDQATVNMTESKVTYVNGRGDFIYAYDNSKLWIKDTLISAFTPETPWYEYKYPKCGLLAYDRSEVEVQNSTVDYVHVAGNCTVHFFDSNVEYFSTMRDRSRINIIGSTMSQLVFWGPNSNVWLTNTTIGMLRARENSKIWLIHCVAEEVIAGESGVWLLDSSVKEIHGKNRVWVVWDWPLFGQITVPYPWAPYILPVIALTVVLIVIVTLFLLIRRKRRKLRELAGPPGIEPGTYGLRAST